MDDPFYDMPMEAIREMPVFSGGNSAAARNHLLTTTRIINKYCLHSQYNREDIKIRLFCCSLDGDILKGLDNWPGGYITSWRAFIKAFIEKYMREDDSPCTPSIVQNNEIDRGDQIP